MVRLIVECPQCNSQDFEVIDEAYPFAEMLVRCSKCNSELETSELHIKVEYKKNDL